ncbi:hypothetical protein K8R33_00435 [archaeon]|nr:hypothetical protein [archaeon]
MERNKLFFGIGIILMIVSLIIPSLLYFKVAQYSSGEEVTFAAVGTIGLTVVPVCGDGICDDGEDCNNCPVDCGVCPSGGSPGGGSGGTSTTQVNFKFDPDVIKEELVQGDSVTKEVNVTNLGTRSINVQLSVVNLKELVFLDKTFVSLQGRGVEEFDALIATSENTEPGVYIGNIVGAASNVEKSLPIVLTIRGPEDPIIVNVNIPKDYLSISPGGIVLGDIVITNKLNETLSVVMVTSMRDQKENVLLDRSDQIGLFSGENLFSDKFETSWDLELGYYFFFVEVTYEGILYSDAAVFKVEGPGDRVTGFILGDYLMYLWILLAIIILIFIIWVLRKSISKSKWFVTFNKKKKEKKEEEIVDRAGLIRLTISNLQRLKVKSKSYYGYELIEEYSKIIRYFFTKFYSVGSGLTFEELVSVLQKKNIKKKRKVIAFITRIAHIPYYYKLMPEARFVTLIDSSITLLKSFKIIKSEKLKKKKGGKKKEFFRKEKK